MNFFDAAALRLKQQLGVIHDKDVAHALGLSPRAWAGRRKTDSFPEDKLFALAAKRPELGIDPQYVLHGDQAAAVMQQKVTAMSENLAARVREVRGERSAGAFAKLIGVSVSDLAQIEAGSRKMTAEEIKRYIAAHPSANPVWLIGGERPGLDEPLTDLEVVLIRNYRVASELGQKTLRHLAAFYAQGEAK